MLIFDTENKPVLLDSIYTPTLTDHMWVLDLNLMDFTMSPLLVLEEIVCPVIVVTIKGFEFPLPANWNILVYDTETSQLDVIELSEAAGREFTALIYGPHKGNFSPATVAVTNYFPEFRIVAPSLNKHQMLCHPIGPDEWVTVSPSDSYNKYLKDRIVGDLIGF
jgi:hypothetical protein